MFRSSVLWVMAPTRCLCAPSINWSHKESNLEPLVRYTSTLPIELWPLVLLFINEINKAPTETRTRVSGFKVLSDNHYTIRAYI